VPAGGGLPAARVPIAEACDVLDRWDGSDELDAPGAVLWRELVGWFDGDAFFDEGDLYAEPFDPADPVGTPSGLARPPSGGDDPVLLALARAVQVVELAGFPVDATLRDTQFAPRGDRLVPVSGGLSRDGVTNVVAWASLSSSTEPALERPADPVVDGSLLTPQGYFVNIGTSFLMALAFTPAGPQAMAILTYGNSGDPTSAEQHAQTERYSAEDWRPILFTDDDIAADPGLRTYVVRS
jgi:acyl-homoserine-lactone acylase